MDTSGKTDVDRLREELDSHAVRGWRLVNSFVNEVGKKAVIALGFGVNATVDQIVLIFERQIG